MSSGPIGLKLCCSLAGLSVCALPISSAVSQFSNDPAPGQRVSPTSRPADTAGPFRGDPLRVQSSDGVIAGGTLYGDFSGDGDVDLEDFTAFGDCAGLSGVGIAVLPPCDSLRWDDDSDVDLWEIAAFQNAFTGPEATPECGNGVVEAGEQCDGGGETALCNADCTSSQCGDGILNAQAGEQCDGGGETALCNADCTSSQCGDGIVNAQAGEQCDGGGETALCNADCTTSQCGDGIVNAQAGEQCDGGPGCNENCQTGGVANDRCQAAIAVGDGTRTYSTLGATTDGPDEPTMCEYFGFTNVDSDIWYCYTATCTGTALASLCGSAYDTKLAVYAGCGCPTSPPLACSDDDCATDLENYQSRVTFAATAGQTYLVRVGGYYGMQGDGQLTIGCNLDVCENGSGDCYSASPTEAPGCGDATCCAATCEADHFCCDVTWDALCAGRAQGVCTGSFPACAPLTGACDVEDTTPGCENEGCCNTVCTVDPYCCLTAWDADCAQEAQSMCFLTCGPGAGDCYSAHQTPGCDLVTCCEAVCTEDSFCCETEWDPLCADIAAGACP